eukprot:1359168-Amorphochlora_amoeboformis.AAC.1
MYYDAEGCGGVSAERELEERQQKDLGMFQFFAPPLNSIITSPSLPSITYYSTIPTSRVKYRLDVIETGKMNITVLIYAPQLPDPKKVCEEIIQKLQSEKDHLVRSDDIENEWRGEKTYMRKLE